MKFYSKITKKPNTIIEEVRHGTKLISQTKLCTFENGVLETDDPEIIAKLEARKGMFRSDRPWKLNNWTDTEEGKKLLEEGERLGIDCRHIRKEYLEQRIQEILHPVKKNTEAPELDKKVIVNTKPSKAEAPKVKVDYKEIMKLAKEKGIKTHKIKKEVLVKALTKKGVNINA